jgi:LemA protein
MEHEQTTSTVWHTVRNFLVWLPVLFGLIILGGHTSTTGLTFEKPADFFYYSVITPLILFALPLFFLHLWNKGVPGRFAPAHSHIVVVTIAASIILTYGTYKQNVNFFNLKDEQVTEAFTAVNIEYQRRFNEVSNLSQVTTSLAEHELEVVTQITNARANYVSSTDTNDKVSAINELENTLGQIIVNVEDYPNLAATEAYIGLMQSVVNNEARLSTAKLFYNQQAREFNSYARVIPHSWYVSGVVENVKKEYLDAEIAENHKDASQLLDNLQ